MSRSSGRYVGRELEEGSRQEGERWQRGRYHLEISSFCGEPRLFAMVSRAYNAIASDVAPVSTRTSNAAPW